MSHGRRVKQVDIFTDGACKGNPGPGGWGVLLRSGPTVKELYGGERSTTNNRMELMAVIQALEALNKPCRVRLSTEERLAFPILARGACLRFLLTRAWDWLNTPADAMVTRKDPIAFLRRLDFYAEADPEALVPAG